ncbi:MAG: hypothetical protein WCP14_04340 [bacterium]
MKENESQKKLAMVAISYVIVFIIGGGAGYLIAGGTKATTGTDTATNQGFTRGQNGAFPAGGARGGGFRGRASGEVTAIDGNTITVKSTDGTTQNVTISDATTYNLSTSSTKDKVVVGSSIAVTPLMTGTPGSETASDSITASAITIN